MGGGVMGGVGDGGGAVRATISTPVTTNWATKARFAAILGVD